ncbi:MAG: thiamine pyrophosphate-dependent dehydrogenase E1 component subunit alpha [Leptospiraceae bacterium]|nr:thiamine pyrophosphate-dependent dehydrogenase E1 component subunit alpha [Leptospiraceae bacterium]MCK6382084.1 thiamine pyrophosphate-dependent dehydrogenase E1 component subunit alpha [Leptospiraceae bacterium]
MKTKLLNLYKSALKIRLTEETIANRYPENKMRCPTHLSIGQEGVAASAGMALKKNDFAVSTHRGHAHYLGKGGSIKGLISELYGKKTGCSGGIGGSMHLCDLSCGFVGTTAIVGNSIPLGVGLGLSIQLNKTNQVSCIFFGDGSTEEGVFYESVNFAIIKNLPVIFICENNLYSVYSPLSVRQPKDRKIYEMVSSLGMKSLSGDGNDPYQVFLTINESLDRIRKGGGPEFLEFSTYRYREHCGPYFDNDIGYRTEAEYLEWKIKDPVFRLENEVKKFGLTDKEIEKIQNEVLNEIEDAFQFAENSEFPNYKESCLVEYKK